MQCVEESWGHVFWILLTFYDLWYLLREKGCTNGPSGYECKTTVARAVRPGKNSIQNEILPQRSPKEHFADLFHPLILFKSGSHMPKPGAHTQSTGSGSRTQGSSCSKPTWAAQQYLWPLKTWSSLLERNIDHLSDPLASFHHIERHARLDNMTLNRRAEVPSKLSNKVHDYMMLHGAIPCSSHSKAYTISFYLPRLYSLIFLGTATVSRMNNIGQQSREQVHQLPLETSIVQNCAPSFNTSTIFAASARIATVAGLFMSSSLLLQRLASLQLLLKS